MLIQKQKPEKSIQNIRDTIDSIPPQGAEPLLQTSVEKVDVYGD
ncbi:MULTISPECIES: hypothetical protein [Bacillaceae]|nr:MULTISPECIES: hypothetical protein [Bacillaceae]MED5100783.1 hypothetical protein [Niallia circulans]